MKIFNAFKTGLSQVLANKKMWLLFFVIQFVFALVIVRPLCVGLDELVGHSLTGQEILSGNGANVLMEYLAHKGDFIDAQKSLFLFMGILYLIVIIFLKGGAVACFTRGEKYSNQQFFRFSGEFFGRFFRLFFISLIYFLAAVLIFAGIDALLKTLTGDSEAMKVLMKVISLALLVFLIFLVRMAVDYAKIMTVKNDENKMIKTSFKAWAFVLRHPAKTLGLFYMTFFFGLLIWAVYYFPGALIPAAGLWIAMMFIWQQVFAFMRNGVNLLFLSSQAALYNSVKP